MGCCYLKAEPFLFFHLVLSLLGSQSYLGCCYLKAKPFLVFYLVLFLLGSCFILDCAFSSHDKLILSMNRDIIKFTYLDFFLCRFNWTLTAKSRDEKAMFVLIKKIVFLLRWPTNLNLITYHKCTFRWRNLSIEKKITNLGIKLPTSKIPRLVTYSIAFTFPTLLSTCLKINFRLEM